MSQITTTTTTVCDISLNRSTAEAETVTGSGNTTGEPIQAITHDQAQALARLKNMAAQSLSRNPASALLKREHLDTIAPKMSWLSGKKITAYRDRKALFRTAEKARETMRDLDSLPVDKFLGLRGSVRRGEVQSEAFIKLNAALAAQRELAKAVEAYDKLAGGPSPARENLRRACFFREGELLNMAARVMEEGRERAGEAVAGEAGRDFLVLDMHGGQTMLRHIRDEAAALFHALDQLSQRRVLEPGAEITSQAEDLKGRLQTLRERMDREEPALAGERARQPQGNALVLLRYDTQSFGALRQSLFAAQERIDDLAFAPHRLLNAQALVDQIMDSRPLEALIPELIRIAENAPGLKAILNEDLPDLMEDVNRLKAELCEELRSKKIIELNEALLARREGLRQTAQRLPDVIAALPYVSESAPKIQDKLIAAMGDLGLPYSGTIVQPIWEQEIRELNALFSGPIPPMPGNYLALAAENRVSLSSVLECSLRGIEPERIETRAVPEDLRGVKALGAGQFNAVTLCTYKNAAGDSAPLVFKAEHNARYGLRGGQVAELGYGVSTRVLDLNTASCYAAAQIGAADVLSASKAGTFDGHFGLFMELAPGYSADSLQQHRHPQAPEMGANREKLEDIRGRLEENGRLAAARANLQRELCKLEWADLLSAQADRHPNNYLVDINPQSGVAKVTGIDNDASFGRNMIGPGVFVAQMPQGETVFDVARAGSAAEAQNAVWHITKHSGVKYINIPRFIDANTFTRIMELDSDPQGDYAKTLRAQLRDEEAVQSALRRLNAAKTHAEALAGQGRVVENWETHRVQGLSVHADYSRQTEEERSRLGGYSFNTLGFYARDCIDFLPEPAVEPASAEQISGSVSL